jgi:hypothetical protein
MQNKANFPDAQMNVTSYLTKNYEQRTMNSELKNKPKTNPTCHGVASGEAGIYHGAASGEAGTCRGVASGEAGTNPTCSELACPARPELVEGSKAEGVEPISKRRKIACFGINYLYNYRFGINIGAFYV